MSLISFSQVTKKFNSEQNALCDLSFDVKEGETLVLLGRSGSGKTSALRLINRLIEPTSGVIYFNGEEIKNLDPIALRRSIGYAIQHIGLFPHMTVEENIGIVPKLLNWTEKKIRDRVDELLVIVGLDPAKFRDIRSTHLSGGQKQRVGVARALAADPPVVLMDEPFGALDPLMREQLQNEFLEIQAKIHKTIVFVTHDLSEAVKMGDRIALLDKGKLLQIATPNELIQNPANDFVEQFLGKDRFQLLLQIKSLQECVQNLKQGGSPRQSVKIALSSSLLEALAAFKLTGLQTICVFDEKKYIGDLDRSQLMESVLTYL